MQVAGTCRVVAPLTHFARRRLAVARSRCFTSIRLFRTRSAVRLNASPRISVGWQSSISMPASIEICAASSRSSATHHPPQGPTPGASCRRSSPMSQTDQSRATTNFVAVSNSSWKAQAVGGRRCWCFAWQLTVRGKEAAFEAPRSQLGHQSRRSMARHVHDHIVSAKTTQAHTHTRYTHTQPPQCLDQSAQSLLSRADFYTTLTPVASAVGKRTTSLRHVHRSSRNRATASGTHRKACAR